MTGSGAGTGTAVGALNAQPVAARVLGGVELREDVPLKGSASALASVRWCTSGPRLIRAAFGVLTACITLALLTQIYCGDYEVVPHGSVSSSAAACSRAGTDALKAGGRAMDAAAAAALCLAVLAPHRTSVDASGSMLYWEYRELRTKQPVLYEWGYTGPTEDGTDADEKADRPPRLVAALAHLHASLGTLPWKSILAPTIRLAREGFPVSEGLSIAEAARGEIRPVGTNITAPELAQFFFSLQDNTSAELSRAWDGAARVRRGAATRGAAGAWRVAAGGCGAAPVLRALRAGLEPPPASLDDAQYRVVTALQHEASGAASGVASGLAVVDSHDTYIALVTGISEPFGSGAASGAGWRRDEPAAPLDLAPAILSEGGVCGARYVLGAESAGALAQAGAALAGGPPGGVERARVALGAAGLLREAARSGPLPAALAPSAKLNASPPYAAVNLVLQQGDALASHADSRGGGLASRF